MCRDGGIGRRDGLKIRWERSRESSSLSPGTKNDKKTPFSRGFFVPKFLFQYPFTGIISGFTYYPSEYSRECIGNSPNINFAV